MPIVGMAHHLSFESGLGQARATFEQLPGGYGKTRLSIRDFDAAEWS
jgi:hypothetical protein